MQPKKLSEAQRRVLGKLSDGKPHALVTESKRTIKILKDLGLVEDAGPLHPLIRLTPLGGRLRELAGALVATAILFPGLKLKIDQIEITDGAYGKVAVVVLDQEKRLLVRAVSWVGPFCFQVLRRGNVLCGHADAAQAFHNALTFLDHNVRHAAASPEMLATGKV